MPKLGDGMPYLEGNGLIVTARVGRPSFPGILFAFPCESAIPTPVEQEQGIVYHNRTRQGGDGEESAFPQQQPIFTRGKLPLKPSLLLEVAFPQKGMLAFINQI